MCFITIASPVISSLVHLIARSANRGRFLSHLRQQSGCHSRATPPTPVNSDPGPHHPRGLPPRPRRHSCPQASLRARRGQQSCYLLSPKSDFPQSLRVYSFHPARPSHEEKGPSPRPSNPGSAHCQHGQYLPVPQARIILRLPHLGYHVGRPTL
jgi:hypothetical protein